MNGHQLLFLLVVFVVVAGVALAAMAIFSPVALRERLHAFRGDPGEPLATGREGEWVERVARVAKPLSKLSLPEEGWDRSPLRRKFINAGWRSATAPTLYFAAKTVLSLSLPALVAPLLATSMEGSRNGFMLVLFSSAALGYYLPNAILSRTASRRQRDIFENIPDALDLMTVCVEAGLSMERALTKVAAEIDVKSVVLAQELRLVLMEMRAGFSKEKALRNFALRSGVEDVDTLVAMLIQADRFGTSMGDSLRVHSDGLRHKRTLQAEEAAAKIGLKLLFPLIFCMFPALMLVLMGPAAIRMVRVVLPAMSGE
ncbi:type II secretion system F family protein [Pseudoduganella umbonata]|uniref:Tight adherence protein C n=1 Tax=Pseudoduganella umbonata TaxID=864828 RepID=A0A4P8HWH2_9BURK|nr:type II secretion system F family protein [Pseudoduganella umbonata]MBB3223773.1 tight adherence protein C [Pseudoduganella umbonata]QCP12804.1 type II secretion system F family protein [Pseudoduganella umbonata]